MKVNFNLLKEKRKPKVKKKSKKVKVKYKINSKKNFDSDFVVYDDQFDNQVRNFNNQSYKNQTPFSSDDSKVALDDVPEDIADLADDETEALPDIPLIKVKKQERKRKEDRLKNTDELNTNQLEDYYIGPGGDNNEESVESQKLDIISGRQLYSVWIYRENEQGKEIILGSIINIPKQGYLISTSPNAFDRKTSSEKLKNISSPEDMPRITKQNWKDALGSDESNFKKFKYSYKEAVDEIFYFKRLRLPDELSDDQKQFRVMPDNFEDAKGEMIPITIQEYNQKTRDEQFKRILLINYLRKVDKDPAIGYDIDDKTMNELYEEHPPKDNQDAVRETHVNGYDDICSIAAMIMVETNASSEKSPFGTTAVALARSDSSSWPTRLHDIVQGPAKTNYVPWNVDKEYAERYNSNKEYIHSILREETQIGEAVSKAYGESFDDNSALKKKYKDQSNNNKNRRRRAVDYALESILRKDELLVRYREATSFIHPESMQKKQNPTKKDRIPYDFYFEKLYKVKGPDNVIDRKNFETVKIENNPKLGIHKTPRYLPKWAIDSIKKGEAFFIPNETALFIK